ncbi:CDP-glycerol glycerophosphotransferase family protein [Selenomonas ruminantium]|uniref:CDP-glycerol glycerophosphotransferase family protein n=1 Tax=Selenomonas ruminantium TaxID=971 RepID=UPI000415DFA2|nr:CDP-glycerol glycerophosphotransferase family protein [Selenomonas ruminantium]
MLNKLKNKYIFRKAMLLFAKMLSLLNMIIPKNERQMLFYDSARTFLDDNTEALYTYLINHGYEKKYKMICCVPNQKKESPFANYKPVGAIRGILAFMTSKYVFFSFGDFRIKPARNQVVVNQWHGMPVKKIGKYTKDPKYLEERLDNFTYLLASSEMYKPIMAKAFGCDLDKVKVLGATRIDYFFSKKNTLNSFNIIRKDYNKLVIWMPTFRNSIDDRFHDGGEDNETLLPIFYTYDSLKMLDEYLNKKNILMVIKIHPMAKFKKGIYKRIKIITNDEITSQGVRLYEFIKEFDALITDYSSIYNEFIILNRYMAFTIDDQENYLKSRGFIFDDINEMLPGPKISNVKEFYSMLNDIQNDVDLYREHRKRVKKLVNKYDRNHCERLVDFLGL